MNGSAKLSDEEKQEMLQDAKNSDRSKVFHSARIMSQHGSLDDYIAFLSENIYQNISFKEKDLLIVEKWPKL